MKIERKRDTVLDTTAISNTFITEYLPGLDGNAVKLYLYLLYQSENGTECTREALAAILNVDQSVVDAGLVQLAASGLLIAENKNIMLENPARLEIERNYRVRTTKRPDEQEEEKAGAGERAKLQMIRAVSDRFFSGQMPAGWYGEIELWMEKYQFAPEVVFMLFQHCARNNVVTKPYTRKVADSWGGKFHIRTVEQLEEYFKNYEEYAQLRKEIVRKLKLNGPLTEYQSEFTERWFYTYGYRMEIISLALREGAASAARPSFNLYDKILTDWYERGLRTPQEIQKHLAERARQKKASAAAGVGPESASVPQKENFQERRYDDQFFNQFYTGGETR